MSVDSNHCCPHSLTKKVEPLILSKRALLPQFHLFLTKFCLNVVNPPTPESTFFIVKEGFEVLKYNVVSGGGGQAGGTHGRN